MDFHKTMKVSILLRIWHRVVLLLMMWLKKKRIHNMILIEGYQHLFQILKMYNPECIEGTIVVSKKKVRVEQRHPLSCCTLYWHRIWLLYPFLFCVNCLIVWLFECFGEFWSCWFEFEFKCLFLCWTNQVMWLVMWPEIIVIKFKYF